MDNKSLAIVEKKVYPSIDLMKFVLAFFVVGIHSRAATNVDLHPVLWYFCNFATSYFFIASGFFLRKKLIGEDFKINENLSGVVLFLKRILQLFLFWGLLYLPSEIYSLATNEHSFKVDVGILLADVFLRGKMGFGITLWYLHSVLLGGGIYLSFSQKESPVLDHIPDSSYLVCSRKCFSKLSSIREPVCSVA